MTTDQTRAIVQAAERLARAIDAEAMHGDDPPPLVVAARLDLARAIALPASPPVPESKLRAVYDAAERLVARNAEGGSLVEAWDALEAAIALPAEPAPAWTSTPPSEPGTYWWRGPARDAETVQVHRSPSAGLVAFRWSRPDSTIDAMGGEWWPVRLQEPPA